MKKNKLTIVLAALLLGAIFISSICGEISPERTNIAEDYTSEETTAPGNLVSIQDHDVIETPDGLVSILDLDESELPEDLEEIVSIDATLPSWETVDIKDLHPLYQEFGYPNETVHTFLHAEEVEPIFEYRFAEGLYDSVKCVGAMELSDQDGDYTEAMQVQVYLTFRNGSVGTVIINSQYNSLTLWGWIPFQDSITGNIIQLKKIHDMDNSVITIQPWLEWYNFIATPNYEEPVERQNAFKIYSELPEESPFLDAECPMNDAKCVYSGIVPLNSGFSEPMYVDVYAYYTDDGLIGTWIASQYGTYPNHTHVVNISDWVFTGINHYGFIELRQSFYSGEKYMYVAPGIGNYGILTCSGF